MNKTPEQQILDESLITAIEAGNLDQVRYYHVQGANLHLGEEWPFRLSARLGHVHIMRYLVDQNINPRLDEDEALCVSANAGQLKAVQYLIGLGADIHAQNDFVLVFSSYKGHMPVVRYALSCGANIPSRAMRWSVQNDHLEVVQCLAEHGADMSKLIDAAQEHKRDTILNWLKEYSDVQRERAILEGVLDGRSSDKVMVDSIYPRKRF